MSVFFFNCEFGGTGEEPQRQKWRAGTLASEAAPKMDRPDQDATVPNKIPVRNPYPTRYQAHHPAT